MLIPRPDPKTARVHIAGERDVMIDRPRTPAPGSVRETIRLTSEMKKRAKRWLSEDV